MKRYAPLLAFGVNPCKLKIRDNPRFRHGGVGTGRARTGGWVERQGTHGWVGGGREIAHGAAGQGRDRTGGRVVEKGSHGRLGRAAGRSHTGRQGKEGIARVAGRRGEARTGGGVAEKGTHGWRGRWRGIGRETT